MPCSFQSAWKFIAWLSFLGFLGTNIRLTSLWFLESTFSFLYSVAKSVVPLILRGYPFFQERTQISLRPIEDLSPMKPKPEHLRSKHPIKPHSAGFSAGWIGGRRGREERGSQISGVFCFLKVQAIGISISQSSRRYGNPCALNSFAISHLFGF